MAADKDLYQELEDRLRAEDKEGAIEAYYQLLSEGRPLSEIIAALPSRSDRPDSIEHAEGARANKPDDNTLARSYRPALPTDPDRDADRTAAQAAPTDGGRNGSPRGLGAARPWRLVKQTVLFLLPGAAIAAVTVAGVLFVHRPSEMPAAQAQSMASVADQPQTEIDRTPKTRAGATAPSSGSRSITTGGSAMVKATSRPNTTAATEALPAPTRPSVVAPPAGQTPPAGIVDEKRVATPTSDETTRPPAPSETAEAKPDAAVAAGPERPIGPAILPAPQPMTVSVPASATESAAVRRAGPEAPRLPTNEIAALLSRGDALLGTGDVASARLFYQRAADGDDGSAALRLGETFDPAFLAQAGMGTLMGDAKEAAFWYRRASELGIEDAALLLQNVVPGKQK